MTISIPRIIFYFIITTILFLLNKNIAIILGSAFVVLEFVLLFREHTKGKSKVKHDKHTGHRSGDVYGKKKREKR